MPKNFHEKLINLLKTDPRFVDDEGELVKAAVMDRAWKIDHDLVRLLLGDKGWNCAMTSPKSFWAPLPLWKLAAKPHLYRKSLKNWG